MKIKIVLQKTFTAIIILSFITTFLSCSNPTEDAADNFIKMRKLKPGVVTINMGYDAVTSILTEKGIVVIDAGISNSLTAKYRKIMENELGRDDFKYLINTHSHSDHTGGNQIFNDALIVGHENCVTEMKEAVKNIDNIKSRLRNIISEYDLQLKDQKMDSTEKEEVLCQKMRYQHTYNDWVNNRIVTYPELTFRDTMNINLENVNFNLIYFGKAHSGSDILIYVPEVKILFVGDLFSKYGRPSIGNIAKADVERWQVVKEWVNKRSVGIEIVIGGHGQIMDKNDLEEFNKYIDEKWAEVN